MPIFIYELHISKGLGNWVSSLCEEPIKQAETSPVQTYHTLPKEEVMVEMDRLGGPL